MAAAFVDKTCWTSYDGVEKIEPITDIESCAFDEVPDIILPMDAGLVGLIPTITNVSIATSLASNPSSVRVCLSASLGGGQYTANVSVNGSAFASGWTVTNEYEAVHGCNELRVPSCPDKIYAGTVTDFVGKEVSINVGGGPAQMVPCLVNVGSHFGGVAGKYFGTILTYLDAMDTGGTADPSEITSCKACIVYNAPEMREPDPSNDYTPWFTLDWYGKDNKVPGLIVNPEATTPTVIIYVMGHAMKVSDTDGYAGFLRNTASNAPAYHKIVGDRELTELSDTGPAEGWIDIDHQTYENLQQQLIIRHKAVPANAVRTDHDLGLSVATNDEGSAPNVTFSYGKLQTDPNGHVDGIYNGQVYETALNVVNVTVPGRSDGSTPFYYDTTNVKLRAKMIRLTVLAATDLGDDSDVDVDIGIECPTPTETE